MAGEDLVFCIVKELTIRQTNVLKLRRSGVTFAYIGDKLGVSRARAQQIYAASEKKLQDGSHCIPQDI